MLQRVCRNAASHLFLPPGDTLWLNISDFNGKETVVGVGTKLAMISVGGSTSQPGSITGLDPHGKESQREGFNMFTLQHFRSLMRTTVFVYI